MNRFAIVGVHWYNRKSNLKECAENFLSLLTKLKEHNNQLFGVWYEKGISKNEAMKNQIGFDSESVKRLLSKKGKDEDFPKLSYKTGIWNGEIEEGKIASLSVSLGSSEPKYFSNFCVIELPYEGDQYKFYQNAENQKLLINLLIEHWEPEWILIDDTRLDISP